MAKVMVFIDGSWLYSNTAKLAADYGRADLQIDYGLLPHAASRRAARMLGLEDIDIVRTHLFASAPDNYDPADFDTVRRRLDFFNLLKEEHHYEVEIYPIDFRGRKVRAHERDPADPFEPREKCVDIALATAMLYYAAVPNAYDIGVAVIGDQDYVPVLQHVRRLAKRVAIVSIRGSCSYELADPIDSKRVKDVDIIWLNDMIPDVELKYEPRQLACQSEFHVGDRRVWTTYRPRKGQPFYCDECRKIYAERHVEEQRKIDARYLQVHPAETPRTTGIRIDGMVYEIKDDRRFGFIRAVNGREYFFHLTDLANVAWDDIDIGMEVSFEVVNEPSIDKAGKAADIRATEFEDNGNVSCGEYEDVDEYDEDYGEGEEYADDEGEDEEYEFATSYDE